MSKYKKFEIRPVKIRRWKVHPIWRGIGCFLLILLPVISYAAAVTVSRANYQNGWVRVPAELTGWVNLAPLFRLAPWLQDLIPTVSRIYYLDLALTFAFIIIAFGILTLVYSVLYTAAGAGKDDPYDLGPVRRSPKKSPR